MKNFTLTSIFIFCFAFTGFGQWEQVDIPHGSYPIRSIIGVGDKLLAKYDWNEYYISDKDSIHWEFFDLKYPILTIDNDTAYTFGPEAHYPKIYYSTDLINWERAPAQSGGYQQNQLGNYFGTVICSTNRTIYKARRGLLQQDTIQRLYSSSTNPWSVSNDRASLKFIHHGYRDSAQTDWTVAAYHCTGTRIDWINWDTDREIIATPDQKRFIIEYFGRFKEKIRHDKYRYLFGDTLTARTFIRSPEESVLLGVDSSSSENFVARYHPDRNWEIVFRYDNEIPFERIDDNYLYGTDSAQFYFLNLNNSEFNVLPFDGSLGRASEIRRIDDFFYTVSSKGVYRMGDDLVWKPINEGFEKTSSNSIFLMEGDDVFYYQRNIDSLFFSENQGEDWGSLSLRNTIGDGIPNIRTVFKSNDIIQLIQAEKVVECILSSNDCEVKFTMPPINNAFRKGDSIIIVVPSEQKIFSTDNFGMDWDTAQMSIFPEGDNGYKILRNQDTLTFFSGEDFYLSVDFGKNWQKFPQPDIESPALITLAGNGQLMYLKDKTYWQSDDSSKRFHSVFLKNLGSKKTETLSVLPTGDVNLNQKGFFSGELYFTAYPEGIFKRDGSNFIRDPLLNEGSLLARRNDFQLLGFSGDYAFLLSNALGLFRTKL